MEIHAFRRIVKAACNMCILFVTVVAAQTQIDYFFKDFFGVPDRFNPVII